MQEIVEDVDVKDTIIELCCRNYMSQKMLERLEQIANRIVRNAWDVFVETSINNQVEYNQVAY